MRDARLRIGSVSDQRVQNAGVGVGPLAQLDVQDPVEARQPNVWIRIVGRGVEDIGSTLEFDPRRLRLF